jgi:hypothetical protein
MTVDDKGRLHGKRDGRYQPQEHPHGEPVLTGRDTSDATELREVTSYDGSRVFVPKFAKGLATIEIEQSSGYPSTHGVFKSIRVDAYISGADGGVAVATATDGSKTGYVGDDGSCNGSWFDLESGREVDVIDGIPQVGVKAEAIANGYWCGIHDEIAYPTCKECEIELRAEGLLGDD